MALKKELINCIRIMHAFLQIFEFIYISSRFEIGKKVDEFVHCQLAITPMRKYSYLPNNLSDTNFL